MPQTASFIRALYLPRQVVFEAWTEPEHLSAWYVPEGCRADQVVVEPVRGGRLEINWTDRSGAIVREWGTFTDITPPEGFLWTLSDRLTTAPEQTTRLRLTLEDQVDACRIVLAQEVDSGRLSGVTGSRLLESYQAAFNQQWERRLDRLEGYFSTI